MAYAVGQLPAGFGANDAGDATDLAKTVVVPVPEYPGPNQIPWARTWFSLAAEHGSAKIRYAIYNETTHGWKVGFTSVDNKQGMVGIDIAPADSIISLARMPQAPGDTADQTPVAWIVQAVLQA
ncbi:hypothetical protein [Kitasatospora sp. McL0602]|uniref:hypothetical protein n=1 Tax=Kitasatospora sp. McL0602 TaxID=3439530 RepID=UPI003F8CE552